MKKNPTLAYVLELIDQLKTCKKDLSDQLWDCPKCKAKTGEPCVSPRKNGFSHAQRQDILIRAWNETLPEMWLEDLMHYNDSPSRVFSKIERSRLYRRLVKLELLVPVQ